MRLGNVHLVKEEVHLSLSLCLNHSNKFMAENRKSIKLFLTFYKLNTHWSELKRKEPFNKKIKGNQNHGFMKFTLTKIIKLCKLFNKLLKCIPMKNQFLHLLLQEKTPQMRIKIDFLDLSILLSKEEIQCVW